VRFRPIVLTSITTFVGLTPIMMDNTISTSMFTPMAISLAFGVLLSTLVTLFLVPCLYMVLEDILILSGQRSRKTDPNALYTGNKSG
jgi:multidrug efflux pump subunit AcrB